MKNIILLIVLLYSTVLFAQKPSKEEMEANKKKFAEAQKQLEAQKATMSPEARKQFEEMMEKMGGNKAMQNAQQALNENATGNTGILQRSTNPEIIPDKVADLKVAATPQSSAQLTAYLTPIFNEVDKLIKPESKTAVKNYLNKGENTGKYAMVFWTHNELDKALYLLLNACINDANDMVSLNNLASLLTISGYAHKSLPILLYAQKLLPQNATILNNTGQAYLSLGNVNKAQPLFEAAVAKDSTNTQAYHSMALIAQKQGNKTLCGNYLEKAIANGDATSQNINLFTSVAPDRDLSPYFRSRFKQFYKDHSITKRFIIPEVPDSYDAAMAAYPAIDAYIKNLDVTITAAKKQALALSKDYEKQVMNMQSQKMAQMQQVMANIGKPGMAKSIQDMKAGLTMPLMPVAATMLASIDNPKFSASYISRLKKETDIRNADIVKLKQDVKTNFDDKIAALQTEYKKLDAGEGKGAANVRAVEIEKELCSLRNGRQDKWLSEIAKINNSFIIKIEDLLNQRLQEYLFWNTIALQNLQDPTPVNYNFYAGYLNDLYGYATSTGFYPYYVDGGWGRACGDPLKAVNTKGKIQEWEREHCEVDINIDAIAVGAKMNCEGFSVYGDVKAAEFSYTRSIDPVTWETTGHSLSAKAGKDKEFNIGKNIKGQIGASVETTIQFDGNMNPVDLSVTGSAGASVKGPAGAGASASLGSATISVNGGFNTSGPGFTAFGQNFLKN